jgi:uncharacterized peroxidase-related enzyme
VALVEAIRRDYRTAPIDASTRALLDFAWKVTREQWECGEADVEGLRRLGFRDETIVDAVGIIGFFNFVTRVADALGVELNKEYAALGKVQFSTPNP